MKSETDVSEWEPCGINNDGLLYNLIFLLNIHTIKVLRHDNVTNT